MSTKKMKVDLPLDPLRLKNMLVFKDTKVVDAKGASGPANLSWSILDREDTLEGGLLFPGVWDLHVHGGGGGSLASIEEREVRQALRAQYLYGTSALLATLPIMPPDKTEKCLAALERVMAEQKEKEAQLLGAYLEGPFINPQMAGGMDPSSLDSWDVEALFSLLEKHPGMVRVVTVAPERPEAKEVIAALVKQGIKVAIGHTEAGEADTLRAVELGAILATHIFNAMGKFHHRAPGAALACLLHEDVTVEFVPEEGHLHPLVQRFILKMKGKGALPISDGTPMAAGGPKQILWMGQKMVRMGGAALKEDGRLFGSAITLLEGLLHLDAKGIWPVTESIPDVLQTASSLLEKPPPYIEAGYRGPLYYLSSEGRLQLVG